MPEVRIEADVGMIRYESTAGSNRPSRGTSNPSWVLGGGGTVPGLMA